MFTAVECPATLRGAGRSPRSVRPVRESRSPGSSGSKRGLCTTVELHDTAALSGPVANASAWFLTRARHSHSFESSHLQQDLHTSPSGSLSFDAAGLDARKHSQTSHRGSRGTHRDPLWHELQHTTGLPSDNSPGRDAA